MSQYSESLRLSIDAIDLSRRELDKSESYNYHDYTILTQINKRLVEIYSRLLIEEKCTLK